MTDIEDLITKYNVDSRNNRLRDFYETDNLWRTLKIERDENRHSSFIAWLLNKDALSDIQFDDGSKSAIKQVQSDACISSAEREQARPKVKSVRIPFRKMKRTTVMKNVNQNNGAKSLLDEVRGLVDNNLRQIHEAISITTTNSMVPSTHKSVRTSMSVAVCLMPYRQNEHIIVNWK
jgi:hypothetical protein